MKRLAGCFCVLPAAVRFFCRRCDRGQIWEPVPKKHVATDKERLGDAIRQLRVVALCMPNAAPHDGSRFGQGSPRTDVFRPDLMSTWRQHPATDQCIRVVQDNLSPHSAGALYEASRPPKPKGSRRAAR
jgi:hypothetical protein